MCRLTMVAAIAALFLSFSANVALAGDDKAMPVTNKMCPLMGDAVDPKTRR